MPPNDNTKQNPLIMLEDALTLVEDAITMAEEALERNPSKGKERDLNETLVKLRRKQAEIGAKLDSLIAGTIQVPRPTAAQVKEISDLTGEVEKQTNAAITASGAVALTSKVLALATAVASRS